MRCYDGIFMLSMGVVVGFIFFIVLGFCFLLGFEMMILKVFLLDLLVGVGFCIVLLEMVL